jgi:CheY-like chemotaxis protein
MTPTAPQHTSSGDEPERTARDEFLIRLGQELRGPLAPISNALYLLRLRPRDLATVESARQVMERQVQHLVQLVDELLDASRLNRGTLALEREDVDLRRIASEMADEHRPAFAAAEVELEVRLPPQPVWVSGERGRLAQVLATLLDRALRSTGPGGRVDVRIDGDGGRASLVVRDSGSGIAAQRLLRLFEPLAPDSSADRASSGGGLGLGLAVAKGLVELHGGTIEAASEGIGRGAELTVRLPQLAAPRAESRRPPAAAPAVKPLSVAIIEDDRDTAESLGVLLELLGHTVSRAHSGAQGVELVKQVQPDVVLCDIGLPEMDGFAVARALRSDPATARARLIAITGYDQEEDRSEGERAGFDRYLIKPVDPEALIALLAAYAREEAASAPAGAARPPAADLGTR